MYIVIVAGRNYFIIMQLNWYTLILHCNLTSLLCTFPDVVFVLYLSLWLVFVYGAHSCIFGTLKGRAGDSWCLPLSEISRLSVWSHFSISPLLFFCLALSLFLSDPFLLLAHSSDLFFPKPPFFRKVGSFVWLLFSCWAVRGWVLYLVVCAA